MRLVFLGPPGAGKGTQAAMVSERLGVPQVSTGDILREAVRRKTELGNKAKTYMDAGDLVPDDIMLSLVEERLAEADCRKGFILDGFPRTLPQATALDEVLARAKQRIDGVVLIDVDDNEVVARLSRRRVCPKCKGLYNLDSEPPKVEGTCDKCGVPLITRSDDSEGTIRNRLKVYRNETLPLVEYYQAKGILARVPSEGGISKVFSVIMDKVSGMRQG
ncbi:MAG TPA: adenylate kinase [bacterium]|nr:adenylate kinase [bacterium]